MSDASIVQGEPTHIGDLQPEELQQLTALRRQSENIVYQIGLNRVAEQRLFMQLQRTEQANLLALNQVGARLGIPDGTAWQVTGDGQAVMIAPPTPPKG